MRVLGVDPGLSGALSVVSPGAHSFVWAGIDMPRDADGFVDVIKVDAFIERYKPDYAFIEAVTGRAGESQSAAFNFGGACFAVRTVIQLRHIPIKMVGSVGWKNFHGLTRDRSPEEKAIRKTLSKDQLKKISAIERRENKNASRAKAAQLIPEDAELFSKVKNDNLAESVLIALYGLDRLQNAKRDLFRAAQV
jgi:hypothetical protein